MATLTQSIEVKEITIDGKKVKLVRLPQNLAANSSWVTPKLFFKVIGRLQAQHDEHVLVLSKLRGLIQKIELDLTRQAINRLSKRDISELMAVR